MTNRRALGLIGVALAATTLALSSPAHAQYTTDVPVVTSYLPAGAVVEVVCTAFVETAGDLKAIAIGATQLPPGSTHDELINVSMALLGDDVSIPTLFDCSLNIGNPAQGIELRKALSWDECLAALGGGHPGDFPYECAASGSSVVSRIAFAPGEQPDPLHFVGQDAGFLAVVDAFANSSAGGNPVDTGLFVAEGDALVIEPDPDGIWRAGDDSGNCTRTSGPAGLSLECFGEWVQYGFSAPYASLVAAVGDQYFLVGTGYDGIAPASGNVRLYFWDSNKGDNRGSIAVRAYRPQR